MSQPDENNGSTWVDWKDHHFILDTSNTEAKAAVESNMPGT